MEEKQIKYAMRQAKASLEIEGLTVTKDIDVLVRAVIKGEITEFEFHKRAMELSRGEK